MQPQIAQAVVSRELRQNVLAEEPHLFAEIGEPWHVEVRPRPEREGVGEGNERMVQADRRVCAGEPFEPVFRAAGDHDWIRALNPPADSRGGIVAYAPRR